MTWCLGRVKAAETDGQPNIVRQWLQRFQQYGGGFMKKS